MKTFGMRVLLFGLLVACGHAFVTPYVVDDMIGGVKLTAQSDSVRVLRSERADVLLFGDSVTKYRMDSEPADSTLAGLLPPLLPSCRVSVVSAQAFHMQLFEAFGRYVSHNPAATRPHVVVIPINFRSFTTVWTERPGWQFEVMRRRFYWDSFAYDMTIAPLSIFKWYESIEGRQDEFLEAPVYFGTRKVGTIGGIGLYDKTMAYRLENRDEAKRLGVITYYMQAVRPESERFQAMVRLARTLKSANIRPLFYITPIDWEQCRKSVGEPGVEQIKANVRAVADGLAAEGVRVRDWAMALGTSSFSYAVVPNEHLAPAGRAWVAQAIATAVGEELGPGGACGVAGR